MTTHTPRATTAAPPNEGLVADRTRPEAQDGIRPSGLHLLLTYRCTLECAHCFVWGSPRQTGAMSIETVRHILAQASGMGTVESIYFEGGEPFLCYSTLLAGTREAKHLGFSVGIVSNAYWGTSVERAFRTLRPLAGLVDELLISSDDYHRCRAAGLRTENASTAARQLGIGLNAIHIAQPEAGQDLVSGQIPPGSHGVMYRGRAAACLARRAAPKPWGQMTDCPYEDLREPERVHVDPYGNVHICQGIAIGSLWKTPLREIFSRYRPETHPITGALLDGGPAELVRRYQLPHDVAYADACHLCDHARRRLRNRFAEHLMPDEMYGVPAAPPRPVRHNSTAAEAFR